MKFIKGVLFYNSYIFLISLRFEFVSVFSEKKRKISITIFSIIMINIIRG